MGEVVGETPFTSALCAVMFTGCYITHVDRSDCPKEMCADSTCARCGKEAFIGGARDALRSSGGGSRCEVDYQRVTRVDDRHDVVDRQIM